VVKLTNGVLVRRSSLLYSPRHMPVLGRATSFQHDKDREKRSHAGHPADSWPVIPDRLQDLGIPRSMVTDLILRYLWLHGAGTLATLNTALKLSFPVLETLFHQFRQQQLLEVKGMLGNDYSFTLTSTGRRWQRRGMMCAVSGPAPVSIQQYHQVVKAQAAHVRLSREACGARFTTWCAEWAPDQLGPALVGHQSLFLYGGTGNGKNQHCGADSADL